MRVWWLLMLVACGFAFALAWQPESSGAIKAVLLLCLFTGWAALVALSWSRRKLRTLVLISPLMLISALLIIPTASPADLRGQYLTELRRFDGTRYVWGGENARGIDCSGLVRASLVTAAWKRGHPLDALTLWWFDASAKALGEGYRGWTREITTADSFATLDATRLAPGDLAVTQDGLHVLAYLGEQTWIQADPTPMRTHVDTLGNAPLTGWFLAPIRVVRWRLLDAN